MKAIGYFRVTIDADMGVPSTMVEQEHGFSRFCAEQGYEPSTVFSDMDSGTRVSVDEYQNMIRHIRKQPEKVIVVSKSLSHIHPDVKEVARCLLELDGLGAAVAITDGEIDDPLAAAVQLWSAQREGESSGDRVREAMRSRAIHGKGMGKPPFGYRIGPDQKLEVVPEEAKTVELIYKLYLQDRMGVRLIARHLNEQGITTRRGGRWSIVGIRDILRNRAYVGTYSRFGVKVPDSHPAIIQNYVFTTVQAQLKSNVKRREYTPREPFLLAGLAYCGYCGNRMMGVNRNQTWTHRRDGKQMQKDYRYYQCQSRANQSFCRYNTRKADDLESSVLAELRKLSDPDARQQLVRQPPTAKEHGKGEWPELTKRVKAIDRKFRGYLDKAAQGTISVEELRAAGRDLVRERQFLSQRLNLIEAEAKGDITTEQRREAVLEMLDHLQQRWGSLDIHARKALLQYVIDRIVVFDKHEELLLRL
jgi:site-specific DNA recombinase